MPHPARVMPALAYACHRLPAPMLSPRETPGTPTSYLQPLAGLRARRAPAPHPSQFERGLSWCTRVGGEVSVAEESSSQKTTGSMPIRSRSCSVAACSPKAPMQKKPQTSTSGVAFPAIVHRKEKPPHGVWGFLLFRLLFQLFRSGPLPTEPAESHIRSETNTV